MIKFILVFGFSILTIGLFSQADLSKWVRPIYEGEESTALSIFDTNPESPDGKYLAFIKYKEIVKGGHKGPETEAYLLIKNRETGDTKQLGTVWTTNHNGANAIWVNDSTIAAQREHLKNFELFNVKSGQSLMVVDGELGHKSVNGIILFSRCNERLQTLHQDRKPYAKSWEGIWQLEVSSGNVKKVLSKSKIIRAFTRQNPAITGDRVQILHVDPSPKGDKILFDYRCFFKPEDKRRKQLQGFVKANGKGVRWVPKRPMHVVWYNNESMLGVEMEEEAKKLYRYDLYGKPLELVAGSACHLGASPDRQWFAGEFGFYKPEADGFTRVYLYQKGEEKAKAILSEWKNEKITWWWVAHVNPSFSADGKRLYFIRAVDGQDKFEAVCIDLENARLN